MTVPTPLTLAHKQEHRASVLVRTLPEAISSARGSFQPWIGAREGDDGTWEAWLEFLPLAATGASYTTAIETHQQTRSAVERWASGITRVYAEGALGRAVVRKPRSAPGAVTDPRTPARGIK